MYFFNQIFRIIPVLLCICVPSLSWADRLVIVINTTEKDERGAVTAPYLDEHRWRKEWQSYVDSIEPNTNQGKIRFVTIRADSNIGINRILQHWLNTNSPEESQHQVVALAIYSHGDRMNLYNESGNFRIQLPSDLSTVLSPLVGRFAKRARVFFSGCDVLWGQSSITAESSLRSIADALDLKDGLIYANYSKGFDPYTLAVSPFNSDVKPLKRLASLTTYLIWPVSASFLPVLSRFVFNQGFVLALKDKQSVLLKVHEGMIFK